MKLAKFVSAKMELSRQMMEAVLYAHHEWSFLIKNANVPSTIMKTVMEFAGDVGEKLMGPNARETSLEYLLNTYFIIHVILSIDHIKYSLFSKKLSTCSLPSMT